MEISLIQKKVLDLFKKSPLVKKFYWTGGTLLAEIYLHHRKSLDLDFFSEQKINYLEIIKFIKILQKELNLGKIEEKKIFDRHEFFLHNKEKIRIEFVLYDYPALSLRKKINGIFIDSLDDIVANKTMAFFDRNDPKDLFDIYFIIFKKKYLPKKLLQLVKKKFGVEFSESGFWSESFKMSKNLDNLKPLLLFGSQKEKTDLIKEIKEYFSSQSVKYLNKTLE